MLQVFVIQANYRTSTYLIICLRYLVIDLLSGLDLELETVSEV